MAGLERVVIDSSVALCWCFEDESQAARQLLSELRSAVLLAPDLLHLEISNVLTGALSRGRITDAEKTTFIALMESLEIESDRLSAEDTYERILPLAGKYGLTAYDASYLELAMRKQAALATMDMQLRVAAKKAGVEVLPV